MSDGRNVWVDNQGRRFRYDMASKKMIPLEGEQLSLFGTEKPDMRREVDLDWCTYYCPCGHGLCTAGVSDREIVQWKDEHRPHTSGYVTEETTARGTAVFSHPPPPSREKF